MENDLAIRLKSKVEELISRYETLDRENAVIKAKLDRVEAELTKKDNKITELEKQIKDLEEKQNLLLDMKKV